MKLLRVWELVIGLSICYMLYIYGNVHDCKIYINDIMADVHAWVHEGSLIWHALARRVIPRHILVNHFLSAIS